jgi:PiT family inorganic phosphate transporter
VAGLAASALYAFAMGGNDMANSVAPLVGSGVLSYRRAIALFAVAVFAGAMFQGYMVMKTLGRGVIRERWMFVAL